MDFQIKFEQALAQAARELASKLSGEVRDCLFGIGLYSLYKTLLILPCDLMIISQKTNATRLQSSISCSSLSFSVCFALSLFSNQIWCFPDDGASTLAALAASVGL